MAAARKNDPMSGLLSNLEGIDSSLFKQQQSMSAQKRATASSATTSGPPRPSPVHSNAKSPSLAASSTPSLAKPMGMASAGTKPTPHPTSNIAGQRDAFSGLSGMHTMQRPTSTPTLGTSKDPPRPPSYDSLPNASGASSQVPMGDDLDALFGGTHTSAIPPTTSNADLGFDFGAAPAPCAQAAHGDLLGSLGSLGLGSDSFTAPPLEATTSQADLLGNSQPSVLSDSTTAQEEYADIFTRIRSRSKDGLSPRKPLDTASSAATASSIPAFEKPAFETPAFEKPAPQQPSSPPPSNSSGYFARFDAGDAHDTATHGDADDPPPPPYNEVVPPDDGPLQIPQTAADVKKQAEKLGRWLAGGARKLAKAAQQKAQEMQANLAHMEASHRVKQRPGHGAYAERMDSDDEGSTQHPPGGGADSPGQGVEDDVPQHYYEWAATLAQIQDASDRQQVLDGMPEDERAVLMRLLKQQGLADPYAGGASAPVTGRAETAAAAAPTQPKAPAKTAAKAPVSTPAAAPQADLLGMSGPAAPVAPVASGVLLGVDAPAASVPPTSTPHPTPAASSASLDDFFSGGARAAPAKAEPDYAALFGAAPAMAGGEMIDFGLDAADVPPEFADLYAKDQGEEGEPELRKQLRARRLAAMHARMREKLAEKQMQEQAEADEKAARVQLREQYKPSVDAWCHQKKDNIRALLSSMHTVMWENSGWTQPSMSDMVEAQRVKRWYMKANLVVHPDKVKQKGGTLEQLTIADMVFDVLKQAWAKFEANELRA